MPPRILSLELQGYKTFASRNMFDFPANITAIVGPNGAGKSNIADSLRWVLGEQTFSLLRGRKTEDMIFSGSDKRPRASMAMATVNFDNSDGWLPIDYSIVSIARRAYRDGQNEYLLNNQRVRLKEISELLANSGLAERTYTIIGQGLVDTALSLKPEERRRFFEEAAGIGLYRTRKDEAEHRLEATRRNIERAQDILLEIEPRLRSLEKQAIRAREYRRIQDDLRLLLRDWYGYHWHFSQDEMAHARTNLYVQEERLDKARADLSQVENESNEIREKIRTVRGQLSQWHNELGAIHQERERVSRELAILEERQKSMNQVLAATMLDHSRIEGGLEAIRDHVSHLLQEAEKIRADEMACQQYLNSINEKFETGDEIRKSLDIELRDLHTQINDHTSRYNQLSALSAEREERQLAIAVTIEGSLDQRKLTEDEVASLDHEVQSADELLAKLEAEKDKLDEQIELNHNRLEGKKEEERQGVLEQTNQEAVVVKLKARIDVLESAERSLTGTAEGAKDLIECLASSNWAGKAEPLIKSLSISDGYEKCISAALGELADGLVIKSGLEIDTVFMMVKENSIRRVAIIDPGSLGGKIVEPKHDIKHPAVIGKAIDFIHADADIKTILNQILSDIYIVKDILAADNVRKHSSQSTIIITLDGDVFHSKGWVLSGVDSRSASIMRPRELKNIRADLEKAEQNLDMYRRRLVSTQEEISRLQIERNTFIDESKELAGGIKRAQARVQDARLQSAQQKHKLATINQQLTSTEKLHQEIITSREKTKDEMTSLFDRIQKLKLLEGEKTQTISDLGADELENELAHWETKKAVLSQRLLDLDARIAEQRKLEAVEIGRSTELSDRIRSTEAAQSEVERSRVQMRENEALISKQITELRDQIDPAEQALESHESLASRSQAAVLTAQQSVTAAERYVSQAQMEMIRQRDAIENMRRRIEDDFGLVDLEYLSEVEGPTPLPIEGLVDHFPRVDRLPDELDENISRLRSSLRRMGVVNLEAQTEYEQLKERFDFLSIQISDLKKADQDLQRVIFELDELMKSEFRKTFDVVAEEFKDMFVRLFGGGSAKLILLDDENPIEGGVEIEAKLPGRREQGLSLLSGGERSLTAVALIFALLKVSPTPFCVLDEVDAMLDEANVGRFAELLRELSQTTQFIIITHNRNTVQIADVIYGVTMGRDSVSQVISLRLDEVGDEMVT